MEYSDYIVFVLSIVVVTIVNPLLFGRHRSKITWWDYTFPYLGIPVWYILKILDVGEGISKTNFIIEMFIILLFSISVPWIRFIVSFAGGRVFAWFSLLLTLSPVAAAVFLRMVMPLLPE